MHRITWLGAAIAALSLTGCGALDGAMMSNQGKPYIYSPQEREPRPGSHGLQVGATGQVSYCSTEGNIWLLQKRRQQALDGIAGACGGADQYRIVGEIADRTQLGAGACQRGTSIVFKCLGAEPTYDCRK